MDLRLLFFFNLHTSSSLFFVKPVKQIPRLPRAPSLKIFALKKDKKTGPIHFKFHTRSKTFQWINPIHDLQNTRVTLFCA